MSTNVGGSLDEFAVAVGSVGAALLAARDLGNRWLEVAKLQQ
jgi:hypothetical protein